MKRNLLRLVALALTLVFAAGLIPAVRADEDVRIRDTAYSEAEGLRAAMSGPVSDTAAFGVTGPEGPLTITEVIAGANNIYTIRTVESIDVTASYTLTFGGESMAVRMPILHRRL